MISEASSLAMAAMAGDLVAHDVGQKLRMDTIYGKPVLCPLGSRANQRLTELLDGEVVVISNIPRSLRNGYNFPEQIEAVHVGGSQNPGFKVMKNGISGELIFGYDEFLKNGSDELETVFCIMRTHQTYGDNGC